MAIIPLYPVGEAQSRPAPNVSVGVAAAGDINSFGGNQARDLQVAGAYLDKASDSLGNIALREAEQVNEAYIQDLNNQFIKAQQDMLYTGQDAFYRKQGKAALDAAPAATQALLDLQKGILDQTRNEWQKQRLTKVLNGHVNEVTNGMSRFVAAQSMAWEKSVAEGRQKLILNDVALTYNDTDKIDNAAASAENVARQQAKLEGLEGTDAEKALIVQKRSDVYATAIEARLRNQQPRAALALYEKNKDKLDEKDSLRLTTAMKSVRTEIDGENAANGALLKIGLPPIGSGESGGGPRENNIGNIRPVGANSGFQSFATFDDGVAATVKNLKAYPKAFNAGQPMSLTQIGQKWAPKGDGDNDPAQWARNVGATAGIDPNKPIDLNDPEVAAKVARGIHAAEWGAKNIKDESAYVPGAKIAFGMSPGAGSSTSIFKGDLKAGYEQAKSEVMNNTNLTAEARQAALAVISKTEAQVVSFQTAAVKSLKDEANATRTAFYLDPTSIKPGQLAAFAVRAEQLGEQELATRYRLFASMESTLKNGVQSLPADQFKMLKELEEGLPKSLLEGIQTKSPEATQAANDALSKLKQRQADGLPVSVKDIKPVVDAFSSLGMGEKAREVATWGQAALQTGEFAKMPPQQQQQMMLELEQAAQKGEMTEGQGVLYHFMKDAVAKQKTAFADDALVAGTSLYPQVGKLVDINWNKPNSLNADLAMRTGQAQQIDAMRGINKTLPLTKAEIQSLKSTMESGDPAQQAAIMRALSNLPPDKVPLVAAALAGKDVGDTASRQYAAALSFYADRDPAAQAAADQVLKGAQIVQADGAGGRKPAVTGDVWQQALQDRIGSSLQDINPQARSVIADAVAAAYVFQMNKAGKQGEKTDPDVLNAAIKTVMGEAITKNGQMFFPPQRGMTSYQFDDLLGRMTDADMQGAMTLERDPVTADVVRRRGVFTNVGDGLYKVRIPDPRRGGDLAEVMLPSGRALVVDAKRLMQRAPMTAPSLPPQPGDQRRRAPASPTSNLEP